ncbi:segregation/condensation protein A [Suttonella sp. R2A3]|uniref:segregation and condensation protein A n=1 Tax=Suttonella sp. R2A3 TaxID=2908648 RepID=UPI001F1C8DC3|nr:segregation/condensation protein A [Suttonella sp. R2A3]UJF24467.1 segregation/condensation protein A [Suttonella sp. R2A3]
MKQLVLVFGEPLEHMPKDLYIPPDALRVLLEAFEGPLDLLLYLIRKHNIDILDIPVALVTEQYLVYVSAMKAQQIETVAEYLLMAATLTEIKARMMLPMPPVSEEDAVEDDPRADLAAQLLAYAANANAAEALAACPRVGDGTLLSDHSAPVLIEHRIAPPADRALLLSGLSRLRQRQNNRRAHDVVEEQWSLPARMDAMNAALTSDPGWHSLSSFYTQEEGRGGQAVSLMAMLELDKRQAIQWQQEVLFAPVALRARVGAS